MSSGAMGGAPEPDNRPAGPHSDPVPESAEAIPMPAVANITSAQATNATYSGHDMPLSLDLLVPARREVAEGAPGIREHHSQASPLAWAAENHTPPADIATSRPRNGNPIRR